jgi:hypothetical protein
VKHIDRIEKELNNEDVSLWYVHTPHGNKILVKAPTTSIKAVYKGCRVEFLFGKDNHPDRTYFHTGITVFDNQANGLNVVGVHRFEEEHEALFKIMQEDKSHVEFYNELGVCFLHGYVSFDHNDKQKVLNFLGDIQHLYSGDLDNKASSSLDSFEYSLDTARSFPNANIIDTLKINGKFSDLIPMKNHFIGSHEVNTIHINDTDEGGSFEKQIWVLFDNLFHYNLYKNPEVILKGKKRELTDILAFHDLGIFLIETKAMAVVTLEGEQTIERKTTNVQKQISKAIDQLVGAKKVLEIELPIYDTKGDEIKFNKRIVPHCVVLVNELVPFGNWRDIEQRIEQAILKENIFLNVFEFMEFMKFIKASKGQKEVLDYHLMERTKTFLRLKSIFIKAKFVNTKEQSTLL